MTGRNIKMTKLNQFLAEIRKAQSKQQYRAILQKFKFKLDQEIPSDISSDYNQTLLHCTAVVDNAKLAEALIAAGASIEAQDREGCTPIYRAIANSSPKVLRVLLKTGALTTAPLKEIYSPLHLAVRYNFITGVKLLLAAKADVRARAEDGQEPIHLLVSSGFNIHETLCAMSASEALEPWIFEDYSNETNEKSEKTRPAQYQRCINLLLQNGADINAVDADGDNALQTSIMTGNPRGIKALVTSGISINHANNEGQTALHILFRGLLCTSTTPNLKILLANGANVNINDQQGQTPLDILEKNPNFPAPWKKKIIKIINSFEHHKD